MGDFNLALVSLDVYGIEQQADRNKSSTTVSLVFVWTVFMQIRSDRRRVWPKIVDLAFKLGKTQIVTLLPTWAV